MNIQPTHQVYQTNLNPLQKSNTVTQVSFKGLEHDTVEISKMEDKSLLTRFKVFFTRERNLSPEETLKSMGISKETTDNILEVINKSDKTELKDNFKTLVSDLPDIEDKELLGNFIHFRALA